MRVFVPPGLTGPGSGGRADGGRFCRANPKQDRCHRTHLHKAPLDALMPMLSHEAEIWLTSPLAFLLSSLPRHSSSQAQMAGSRCRLRSTLPCLLASCNCCIAEGFLCFCGKQHTIRATVKIVSFSAPCPGPERGLEQPACSTRVLQSWNSHSCSHSRFEDPKKPLRLYTQAVADAALPCCCELEDRRPEW